MNETVLSILIKLKDEASAGFSKVSSSLNSMSAATAPAAQASKALAIGLAAAGAAAVGFGVMAVKAASEAQVKMAGMDATLRTMNGNFDKNREAVLKAASAVTKLGFDDETAAVSIANLYQRTGDLNKSVELNALAMDLARAKHLDLATASNMVGMVMSGNGKVLKQFGIELDDTKGPMIALAELQKKVAGQADAASKTFLVQKQILGEVWGNFLEDVGTKLLPLLSKLMVKITDFAQNTLPKWEEKVRSITTWLKEHQVVIYMVAGAIMAGLIPAIIAWAAAMWPLIVAFAASAVALAPFLIGGAIIGGIVFGIIWLIKHWDLVKAKATEVWEWVVAKFTALKDGLVAVLTSIGNFFKAIWDVYIGIWKFAIMFVVGLVLMAFDAMGIDLIAVFQRIGETLKQWWESTKAVFGAAMEFLKGLWMIAWTAISAVVAPIWNAISVVITKGWDFLKNMFKLATDALKKAWEGMWQGMGGIVTTVWEGIKNTVLASLNWIVDKINSMIRAVNNVASRGAKGLGISIPSIPEIPRLAEGGIVTRPTLALIGEAGPEAVVPLSRMRTAGGPSINIYITGNHISDQLDIRDLAEAVGNEIVGRLRINQQLDI